MSVAGIRRWTLSEYRSRVFLGIAAGLALALQIAAIHRQSLSGDGAHHLLAGHQALRYGQNTLNLEHPPLVKLVAALPLLLEEQPVAAPLRVEHALAAATRFYARPELRRATIRGRYLVLAVFVLPFLFACYAVGRRFGDRRTGVVLALMSALSLSVLPYLTVLQTDVAVALAFLLTVLQATRYTERPSVRTAALLALACGLGLAVKFSAVLLGPTVLVSVLLSQGPWRRRLGHLVLIGAIALATLEATYLVANPAYSSDVGREVIRAYCDDRGTVTVDDRMLAAEPALLAVERLDPRLAQWLTGLWGVRLQDAIGVYSSFAFGAVRSQGRWWYFPAVLLIKTPIPILLAALAALVALRRRRAPGAFDRWREGLPMAVTVAVYLAAAVTSNYNLSVRHLLPILPFLYLPVAAAVARSRAGTVAMIGALAIESLVLAPLWMSQTNTWWLGAGNPTRFALSAGNLEYRQNFIELARRVEERGLGQLHVLYPTIGEEVVRAYLPDARLIGPGDTPEPGWYAVNVIVEQFVPALLRARPEDVHDYHQLVPAARQWQSLWQAVRQGEDHGYVAGTFRLYRLH